MRLAGLVLLRLSGSTQDRRCRSRTSAEPGVPSGPGGNVPFFYCPTSSSKSDLPDLTPQVTNLISAPRNQNPNFSGSRRSAGQATVLTPWQNCRISGEAAGLARQRRWGLTVLFHYSGAVELSSDISAQSWLWPACRRQRDFHSSILIRATFSCSSNGRDITGMGERIVLEGKRGKEAEGQQWWIRNGGQERGSRMTGEFRTRLWVLGKYGRSWRGEALVCEEPEPYPQHVI